MSKNKDARIREAITPAKVARALEQSGIVLKDTHLRVLLHYMQGATKTEAVVKSGLQEQSTWSVFNHEQMVRAVGVAVDQFLAAEATPAAFRALYTIVSDDKAPAGPRIQAANSLLDRAGYSARRNEKDGPPVGDLTTASIDELRTQITKLEAELKDITPDDSPDSKPMQSYHADFE